MGLEAPTFLRRVATGIKKEDLTPLRDGLKKELAALPKNYLWWENDVETAMDNFIKEKYDI